MKYFALLSAIALAAVSAFFSVYGLAHIFALSVIPIVVMGGVLEIGKVATALFIHRNWKQLGIAMKGFLLTCTIVLAVLTSVGIFGFLAKSSQGLAVQIGTQQAQVDYVTERLTSLETLKSEKQTQLKNLDGLVGIYSAQTDFKNARQATKVYSKQSAERKQLQAEIRGIDSERLKLTQERLAASNEMRKTEVDVGPAVYVAQAIYGKKDIESVEGAIRIIILMIIFAFDPLAICLMLAIQKVYLEENKPVEAFPEPTPADFEFLATLNKDPIHDRIRNDDSERMDIPVPDGDQLSGDDLPADSSTDLKPEEERTDDAQHEDIPVASADSGTGDLPDVTPDTAPESVAHVEHNIKLDLNNPRDRNIQRTLQRWEKMRNRPLQD